MESIIGAQNALILNRLVTRVNSGQGKNVPVSIIVDELPTLYFHKIDRLIGTARSNKVAVTQGFQELPQLEADYGKVGKDKIITTMGNVINGSARSKDTLGSRVISSVRLSSTKRASPLIETLLPSIPMRTWTV